jgi:hypothetical protein
MTLSGNEGVAHEPYVAWRGVDVFDMGASGWLDLLVSMRSNGLVFGHLALRCVGLAHVESKMEVAL